MSNLIAHVVTYSLRVEGVATPIASQMAYNSEDAQELIAVAMDMGMCEGMCDTIKHTLFLGDDVITYTELFLVNGTWAVWYTNNRKKDAVNTTLEVMS